MLVTPSGMLIEVKLEQPPNAWSAILQMSLGITVFTQPAIRVFVAVSIIALQSLRESYLGLFLSTVIEVKLEQPPKALIPILVTPSEILIEVKLEQLSNALLSMLVTPLGILIDVKL